MPNLIKFGANLKVGGRWGSGRIIAVKIKYISVKVN